MVSIILTYKYDSDWRWFRFFFLTLLGFFIANAARAQATDCPDIASAGVISLTVCSEKVVDSLQVRVAGLSSGGLEFVRFDALQTNPYTGYGSVSVGDVYPITGMATLRNVSFPPHWEKSDRIYYVYARLKHEPTDPKCMPFALIKVFVRANPTASVVVKEATCYSSESQQDGQVSITGFDPTETYEMAENGAFTGQRKTIPTDGVLVDNISRTGIAKTYFVRITNSLGCSTDRSITMTNTRCECLPSRCLPLVISKTRSKR